MNSSNDDSSKLNYLDALSQIDININMLPLREVREKYFKYTKTNTIKYAEVEDIKSNCIYPLYQVAKELYGNAKEGIIRYRYILEEYSSNNMVKLFSNMIKNPWTFNEIVEYNSNNDLNDLNIPLPIRAYTKDSCIESEMHGSKSYYRQAYSKCDGLTICTGLYGTLHTNQLINLNINEGVMPDYNKRVIRTEQRGILCSGHTAHSTEAGLVRRLVHLVKVRMWSKAELTLFFKSIQYAIILSNDKSHRISISNIHCYVSKGSYEDILLLYKNGELVLATLYEENSRGNKCIYINITNGVLIKKVGNCYYDSISLDRSKCKGMEDYFSTIFLTMVYLKYNRPPRTLIASNQSIQGLCHPILFQSNIYKPHNKSIPLVVTKFMKESGIPTYLIPGENLTVGLINLNDNYEDCFLINELCIRRGAFKYTVITTITVDSSTLIPTNEIISMEKYTWWCIEQSATVISSQFTNEGKVRLVLERVGVPVDGDKVATLHGQKGVLKIISEESMFQVYDSINEKMITLDLAIAISSVLSRVTVGQILELRASRICYDLNKSKDINNMESVICEDVTIDKLENVLPGRIYNKITKSYLINTEGIELECEWGYGRVQLLHHMTAGKHHFTRLENKANTKYSASGRSGGGSVKIGDMEMEALISSGLPNVANELIMRRDLSIVGVCTVCNRQCMLCDCKLKDNKVRKMFIPYSTIVLDIISMLTNGRSFEYFPSRTY